MAANYEKKNLHIEKTIKGFSYSIIGTLLPMILATIPALLFNRGGKLLNFLDEGEVLLFGAALFTSAIFLYGENKNSIVWKTDKVLSNVSLLMLIVCSTFYAILYSVKIFGDDFRTEVNYLFVRIPSIILFLISVFAVYRGTFLEFKKIYPTIDVIKESEDGVDGIMNQL